MSAPLPPVPPVPPAPPLPITSPTGWQNFSAAVLRGYHAYGSWLVSISWKRFIALSILLLIAAGILQALPPFSWNVPQALVFEPEISVTPTPPKPPRAPTPPKAPNAVAEKPATAASAPDGSVQISIDKNGIRIRNGAEAVASAASSASSPSGGMTIGPEGIEIKVPPGSDSEVVRDAVREARDAITQAIEDAREAAADAEKEKAEERNITVNIKRHRPESVQIGEFLPRLAFFWIAMSTILKITYKGRMQAEVKAAQATETAEAESLKRQVVEARMAAMQAQVEPHFLFNTLASIDHLIETDPKRASVMQKNLITLLRASMPTMREANATGVRDLGREMAVITPYLEILKVRMEDRLTTRIDVPEGLRSAAFPPMMIQSLVENAIKHGLEPKPEGGTLSVKAEIVHGKLAVTVADTGLGFGKAATAGTGIGLNNIRERLQLLYGSKATLKVAENTPSGTAVTITVPYVAHAGDDATMAA